VKSIALIAVPAFLLAACSTGNDRPWTGNDDLAGGAVHLDAFTDPGRPEGTAIPDKPSLVSIDRSNWAPQRMVSPMDAVSATRTYTVNYMWTDATARQRGQMPSPVSSLELSGDSYQDQVWEAAASWPLAFVGFLMIAPRMITHSPTHEVRYFPQQYWRAPTETPRKPTVAIPSDAESAPARAQPADVAPASK
jgi:hypothetical protein